jgi:hypothetical protein
MKPVAFRLKVKFETLIKLADEGLGTTLLPIYIHLKEKDKLKLRHFKEPNLQRKSYFSKSELKFRLLMLRRYNSWCCKGAIVFQNSNNKFNLIIKKGTVYGSFYEFND